MGREIRRVPAEWKHPKNSRGHHIPLHDGFTKDAAEWDVEAEQWANGLRSDFRGGWKPRTGDELETDFDDWHGPRPSIAEYMPDWPTEQRTHLMMYETTSEGTPISPAFETPEALARWLADNNASALGQRGATYEQWLATCRSGWAPSAVFSAATGLTSGVAAMSTLTTNQGDDDDRE